ncbi:MAG: hypothetical protein KKD44_28005 [Proteobacteria bacterium]|nr:hypothetical protein [Pseudomonadota bacterium]
MLNLIIEDNRLNGAVRGLPLVKECTKCGECKAIDEFYKAKNGKYGKLSMCKECYSKDNKRYIAENNNPRKTEGTKVCTKCGGEKDVSEFSSRKRNKDGLLEKCKACCAEYNKEKKERSVLVTEGIKACSRCGKEKSVLEFGKLSTSSDGLNYWCKECENKRKKVQRTKHRVKHLNYAKMHRAEIWANENKRRKTDITYKLACSLRTRTNLAVKKGWKSGSAVRDLGCSIEFFKEYLESQFTEGMTWDNWGRGHGCWNIDHIIPLVSFDLTIREQFLEAAHYTNMQPLWFEDNMSKGSKLDWIRSTQHDEVQDYIFY